MSFVSEDIFKRHLQILLVDDDPDDYLIARDLLSESRLRFSMEWCSTYKAALDAIAQKRHDVYFFDYHLGATTGFQLLLEARQLGLDKPIIMLTGLGDVEADTQALQAGAADYLVKGNLSTPMLERAVRHALERARMLKALEDQIAETNKLALVASHTSNMVVISDAEGQLEWVNDSFVRVTGYTLDEVRGRKPGSFLQGPATDFNTRRYISESVKAGQGFSCEIINYTKDKSPYWVRINAQPIYDNTGRLSRFIAIESDITEHKRAEAALRESEERYALAARGASDGLWDWDIEKHTVYYSPRWKSMLGYDEDGIGATLDEWLERIHPEDSERVQEDLKFHLEGHSQNFESEHRVLHKDGTYRWVLNRALAVRNARGDAVRMAGWQTDSSGRVAAYDALTNLPNRTLFIDRLRRALGRSKRSPEHNFAVLYIDLDGFKLVNDTLGHAVGDKLLIEAALRLNTALRQSDDVARMLNEKRLQDTVARFGGDEFAVLIEDFNHLSDITQIVRRLLTILSAPYVLESQQAYTTASIGVALGSATYQHPEEMLRDADIAMYRAKHDGKARYALFDQEMHRQIKARFSLEADLRRALEHNEFRVFYQPIIDLKSGEICGVEALLRWQRSHQVITPDVFIPLSEETGLIIPLEVWVLETALRQLKDWHQILPGLNVSVNISGRHFESMDLVHCVESILGKTGIAPAHLALEVTEGVLNQQEERVCQVLGSLQQMGVRIYLDDFGTGYSSLSRLQSLPINVLKIDRSFMMGMKNHPGKASMVEAIVLMAGALELQVVAEGIEQPQQQQFLQALGCHYGQGYLFSRPVSAEDLTMLLQKRPVHNQ